LGRNSATHSGRALKEGNMGIRFAMVSLLMVGFSTPAVAQVDPAATEEHDRRMDMERRATDLLDKHVDRELGLQPSHDGEAAVREMQEEGRAAVEQMRKEGEAAIKQMKAQGEKELRQMREEGAAAEAEHRRLMKKMEEAQEEEECGPPKGCYCNEYGVWIDRYGEETMINGQPLQCEAKKEE